MTLILFVSTRSGAEGSSSPSSSNKTFANDSRTQYHKHGNRYEKTPDLSSPATPIASQHALNSKSTGYTYLCSHLTGSTTTKI